MSLSTSLRNAKDLINNQISEIRADLEFGLKNFRRLLSGDIEDPNADLLVPALDTILGTYNQPNEPFSENVFADARNPIDHLSSFGESARKFGGKPIDVESLTTTVVKSLGKSAAIVLNHARDKGAEETLWTLHLLNIIHERKVEVNGTPGRNTKEISGLIAKVDNLVLSKGDKTLALVAQMASAVEDSRRSDPKVDHLGELLDKMSVYRRSIKALSDALHGLGSMDPFRAFESVRASFPTESEIPEERRVYAETEDSDSDDEPKAVRVKSSGGPVMTTDQIFHIFNPENPGMRTYFSGEQAYNNLLEEWRPDLAKKMQSDKALLRSEVNSAVDRALAELNLTEFLEAARKAAHEERGSSGAGKSKTKRSDRERALVEDLQGRINDLLSKYDQMVAQIQKDGASTIEGLILTQSSGSIFNAMRKEADQYPEDIQLGLKVIDNPLFEFTSAQRQIMAAGLISAYMMRRYVSKEPILAPYIADLKWFDEHTRKNPNSDLTTRFNYIHAQILPLRDLINATGGETTYAQVGQVLGATRLGELREEVVREKHLSRRAEFDKALSTFRPLFQSEEVSETGTRWRWHPGFSAPGIRRDALKECIYFKDHGWGRPISLNDLTQIKRAIMREQLRDHPKAYFQAMPIADADKMEHAVIVAYRKWLFVERQLDAFLKERATVSPLKLNPLNPGDTLIGFKPATLSSPTYQLGEEFESVHGIDIAEVVKRAEWYYPSLQVWQKSKEEWLRSSSQISAAATVGLVFPAKKKDESSLLPDLVTFAQEWVPTSQFTDKVAMIEQIRESSYVSAGLTSDWHRAPYLRTITANQVRSVIEFIPTFERIRAGVTPEFLEQVERAKLFSYGQVMRWSTVDGKLTVTYGDNGLKESADLVTYYDPATLPYKLNTLETETITASKITPRWIARMRDLITKEGQDQIEAKGHSRFSEQTLNILSGLRLPRLQQEQVRIETALYHEIDRLSGLVKLQPQTGREAKWIGPSNHFKWRGGEPVGNFGKVKEIKLADVDAGYLDYIIRKDFPPHVKRIAELEISRRESGESTEAFKQKLREI